jgi:hypothetical protein
MSYTKKQALSDCLELWREIEKNAEEYFRRRHHSVYVIKATAWKNRFPRRKLKSCPACSYNSRHSRNYCGDTCLVKWRGRHCAYGEYRGVILARTEEEFKHACTEVVKAIERSI